MADNKVLACVGLNGFELARVRLLLSEAGNLHGMRWVLGSTDRADLLLLADGSPEAEAAGLTAAGRGVHCVYVRPGAEAGIDTLPAGFACEDLAMVLSAVSSRVSEFRSIDASTPEFFETAGVVEAPPGASEPAVGAAASFPLQADAVADDSRGTMDLERILRRDSAEYTLDRIVPVRLSEETTIDPVLRERPSSRAKFRGSVRNPYGSSAPVPAGSARVHDDAGESGRSADAVRALEEYLREGVLVAPCRLHLEGAEPLVLDPKHKVYMIAGDLAAAEPYALARFAPNDFKPLTTRELQRWRDACEEMPYLRLEWLMALRHSDGWLPRHLDPGGSYCVRRQLDLDRHFDAQVRISEVLREWHRLHEVAAQTGVDMQTVYHCVAAFDAIGWLDMRPRTRNR